MERIAVIGFTKQGCRLAEKLSFEFRAEGMQVLSYAARKEFLKRESGISGAGETGMQCLEGSLKDWTREMFRTREALVFVGACGIAVRSIAPFLADKWEDPAVLVVDELGKYVIPVLSGHAGGANALSVRVAAFLGAVPVLTTATDVNGRFAVDVFARENDLRIKEKELAKEASARILNGERLAFFSELSVSGELPEELYRAEEAGETAEFGICITKSGKNIGKKTLHLYPARLCVGLGCRRQTKKEAVAAAVSETVRMAGYSMRDVQGIYSIDMKAGEPGILDFCREEGLPFRCYGKEALWQAEGSFSASAFVEEVTGVDNVCERAAVLGSGGGALILRKQAREGVTTALALGRQGIRFD